jgi:AcrR family transcriptional regulator
MTAQPTAKRQRKPPAERRRDILEATLETAIELGLDGVTVRDVARSAGVVPGLIHHYFAGIEELLAEAFSTWATDILERVRNVPRELPVTVRLAALFANLTLEQRFWHDALGAAVRHQAVRMRATQLTIDYVDYVESVIIDGIEQRELACADPRSSAWRLILLLDGLVPMVFVLGLIELPEARALFDGVIERELGLSAGTFADVEPPAV